MRSWCLRRIDSATMEQAPPGPSKRARVVDEKNDQIAHHRIVAGRRNPKELWPKQQFASHRQHHLRHFSHKQSW